MTARRAGRSLVAATVCICSLAGAAGSAAAQQGGSPDPPEDHLAPGLPTPTDAQPHPVPRCPRAGLVCINDTIRHMERLQRKLGCDHRGVFATTYLILTREIREVLREDPDFFRYRDWVIYQDSLFANLYFRPITEDAARRPVPEAWEIAFQVAADRDANAGQDMLLGINAHIQRDMPYMLAELGTRTRQGTSRKPDHDKVNEILARAYEPVVEAVGRWYDPLITTTNSGWTPADNIGGLELVRQWRETAWRNAERLLLARTRTERRAVAASIERNAATWAHSIASGEQPGYRERRDAYCRRHLPFAASAPKPPFAVALTAAPRRVRMGDAERFRFRATVSATGWWHAPVKGATVRFRGSSTRTNERGQATITARLDHPGNYTATARRDGLRPGRATVSATAERRDPESSEGADGGGADAGTGGGDGDRSLAGDAVHSGGGSSITDGGAAESASGEVVSSKLGSDAADDGSSLPFTGLGVGLLALLGLALILTGLAGRSGLRTHGAAGQGRRRRRKWSRADGSSGAPFGQ